MYAYDSQPMMYWSQVRMQNLPGWANTEFYDVDARIAAKDIAAWSAQNERNHERFRDALRSALKERCKLALHAVPSEMSYYSLVVAKQGAKLKASVPDTNGPEPPRHQPPHRALLAQGQGIANTVRFPLGRRYPQYVRAETRSRWIVLRTEAVVDFEESKQSNAHNRSKETRSQSNREQQ
jgi:uncharacterized protein (TIGR03435 family)